MDSNATQPGAGRRFYFYTRQYLAGCVLVFCGLFTTSVTWAAPTPCSDSFGYTCEDVTSVYEPATEILYSSDLSPVQITGNSYSIPINLPFPFQFYGQTYNTAFVSPHGLIQFIPPATTAYANSSIPSDSTPKGSIMPFWDHLYIASNGAVKTATHDTEPYKKFVIEWNNALLLSNSTFVTIQAILYENGDIVFQYANIDALDPIEQGGSATIGIIDHTGEAGIQYSYNSRVVTDALAIRFSPPQPDTTGPVITINTPPNGASYPLNEVVNANYSCSDLYSGVATCTGPVANNNQLDTSTVGAKNFKVNATDNLGNASDKTNAYNINYNFSGFFPPVDISNGNNRILNLTKAGSSVPFKFSLSGNQGLDIILPGYPSSQAVNCSEATSNDPLEITAALGSSGLSYDATTNWYNYVWKTDKTWANTCRVFVLKLLDGAEHRAYFSFTK
jgi:hypothetical protein